MAMPAGTFDTYAAKGLREDLAALRLTRLGGVGEPEDHIAAVCEVMRLLAAGDGTRPPAPLEQQRAFFDRHLRPWYRKFGAQCRAAPSANYYQAVARLLEAYLDIEARAFDMAS